jgi:hypothetical protein
MSSLLHSIVEDADEVALERAYFDGESSEFFEVDWRAHDDEIARLCAASLKRNEPTAEWREKELYLRNKGAEVAVPLKSSTGDRHITVCALNELLGGDCEIRYIVCSCGNDGAGFAVLTVAEWNALEASNPQFVAENFIDPRVLPNVMTELSPAKLPSAAFARWERMVKRNLEA